MKNVESVANGANGIAIVGGGSYSMISVLLENVDIESVPNGSETNAGLYLKYVKKFTIIGGQYSIQSGQTAFASIWLDYCDSGILLHPWLRNSGDGLGIPTNYIYVSNGASQIYLFGAKYFGTPVDFTVDNITDKTKLYNMDTICSNLINDKYDAFVLGCTINDADADKNTTILQQAINSGKSLLLPDMIPISNTLTIPLSYSGKKIVGANRRNCGLKMVTDNKTILEFTDTNTQFVVLSDLTLKYKNQQQNTNTDSKAIYFYSATDGSDGWYWNSFIRLRIIGAYDGIAKTKNQVVWGCDFNDIEIRDTINNAINLNSNYGQLANNFNTIRILNYELRDTTAGAIHNNGSRAIIIKGEHNFNGLDIEDWWTTAGLYLCEDGNAIFTNVHIERIHLTDVFPKIFSISGNSKFENVTIRNTNYESATSVRWFNSMTSTSQMMVNNIFQAEIATNNATRIYAVGTDSEYAKIIINNVNGLNIYSTMDNPEIGRCTNLSINSKTYNEIFTFSTPPTNINVNKNDIFYNSNSTLKDCIGWRAYCNGYANPTLTGITATTNYNSTIAITGADATQTFKIGDGITLNNATDTIYIVTNIPSASQIIVSPNPSGNFTSVPINKTLPVYYKLGTDIIINQSIITPEIFGAVGDGIVDDGNALNNTYNYARSNKLIVKLTKPIYLSTKTINAKGVTTISEVGSILDIRIAAGINSNAFTWGGENTGVSGITFYLSNSVTDTAMQGIYNNICNVKNQWFTNNRVIGKTFKSDGITGNIYGGWYEPNGISGLRICNNYFDSVNYPIQINQQVANGNIATPMGSPIENVFIEDNIIVKGTIGINTPHVYCRNVYIKNNRITSPNGFNINVAHTTNFIIDGNICDGATNSTDSVIHVEDVSYAGRIINNIVRSQSGDGIRILLTPGPSQDVATFTESIYIGGNDVKGTGIANTRGIHLVDTNSQRIIIANNHVEGYDYGIVFNSKLTDIINNKIKSCTLAISAVSSGRISGLTIEGCSDIILASSLIEINDLSCIGEIPNLKPRVKSGSYSTVIYKNVRFEVPITASSNTAFNLFTLPDGKYNFSLMYKIGNGTTYSIGKYNVSYDGTTFTPTKLFETLGGSIGTATLATASNYLTASHYIPGTSPLTANYNINIDNILYTS